MSEREAPSEPSWTIDELAERSRRRRQEDLAAAEQSQPEPVGQASARAAYEVSQRIVGNVRMMHTLWIKIAEDLFRFSELQMFRDLGYSSFEQWLAEPEVDLSRRTVFALLDVWRELVVNKGVKPARLENVGWGKVQEVLPAVRRGQITVDAALADVETLTRGDLRERYRAPTPPPNVGAPAAMPSGPDTSTGYEATSEPAYAICPACGSRYQVKS